MSRLEGVRVFLTGHTGFKGSWAVALLRRLGATVTGYALAPPTQPSLFEESSIVDSVEHRLGDVRDAELLARTMRDASPDCVLHLAAQSLVLEGLRAPVETYAVNVLGTANVLEAMRHLPAVRAAVIVTSDKCYEPAPRALRENDPLGGHDPYSASKAAAEMVLQGYRAVLDPKCVVASARAGNVIGGGDWADRRLFADLARAALRDGRLTLRHPEAVRPWQHVLDALAGYVAILSRALSGDASVARAWNFGPSAPDHVTVRDAVERFSRAYGSPVAIEVDAAAAPENPVLRLESGDARERLGWVPAFGLTEAIDETARFYRRRAAGEPVRALLEESVDRYAAQADPA
ncbi:MAG TPA: CDP-glucose 4,6-dehydratase [Candidatus Acidoferrales bacterium]|nr:CDP-glucose 4,6-dehydratase [Candidatus Acidoferrales bacterium]